MLVMREPLLSRELHSGFVDCAETRDGLFVKLRRSFVSRDTRMVLSMAIGELSISAVMVLDCLFGVLWMDESAIPSKLGMVGVPCCCDSLVSVFAQWEA